MSGVRQGGEAGGGGREVLGDAEAGAAGTGADGAGTGVDGTGADGTEAGAGGTGGGSGGDPGSERRLHPVTPLRRAWAPFTIVAGWAIHDPNSAQQRLSQLTATTLLLASAAVIVGGALYGFLSWWFTHFSVTDTELRIRTGLFFRRTAHIRLDRLQAVDVTRPLLARVAGVAKLKLDVVGAEKKDELAYLGEREAAELRAELLARAAGFAPEQAREVGEAPVRNLLHVQPRMLAVSLLLTGGPWVLLVAALAVPTLLWLATHNVWTVLATAIPMLGGAFASSGGRFIKEYDWTVGESPDGLRIDYGLLDKAHETVPPGRVQTVHIVQPLLWRRLGWVRVELDVAGSANGVLVPVAPRAQAAAVIGRVLPGVRVPDADELVRPPARAAWCVPLWWKGYGLAITEEVFAARHGLLKRRLSLVPHAKVQSVRLSQGPWERHKDVADVRVDTGANKTVTARLRPTQEARALLNSQADRSRTSRKQARPDRWMS
ncbi:PH domain-containing protein [Streptomyces sp. NPDC005879]|uniref:PH domain-containing protein n=2 Tax=unclassified Streptomyces TaxID=2593676 RepID=UPI0033D060CD